VLHHRFVDGTRRRARQRLVSVGSAESERAALEATLAPMAPPDGDSPFDVTRLAAALAQLSVEHRTVLLMHDAEGYKLMEIQEITGTELGTLKSRLHRARARLRELLGDAGTF
jgi:RNA polymerase sigma-70 factor (ECF subfamily)